MGKKEYMMENEAYLQQVAAREGVNPLPSGLYYEVIEQGEEGAAKPCPTSVVTVWVSTVFTLPVRDIPYPHWSLQMQILLLSGQR